MCSSLVQFLLSAMIVSVVTLRYKASDAESLESHPRAEPVGITTSQEILSKGNQCQNIFCQLES